MKKILLILCALLLTAVGASAQTWTAPQPTASSLTSGNDYYLYNTEAGQYACMGNYQWGTNAIFGDNGLLFTLASASTTDYDGTSVTAYTMTSSNGQLFWDGTYLYCDGSSKTDIYFVFTETSTGSKVYTIHGTYAAMNTYIGYDPSVSAPSGGYGAGTDVKAVLPALTGTEGQGIEWELIAENDYELYLAKLDLYNVLVEAEEMGMTDSNEAYTTAGEVYTSTTATVEEIEAALVALELAMDVDSDYHTGDEVTVNGTKYEILTDNAVVNHSFELGFEGWTDATTEHNTLISSNFDLRTGDAQHKDYYLVGTTNGGSSAAGSINNVWSMEAGKTYYFSYWVKGLSSSAINGYYLMTSVTNTIGDDYDVDNKKDSDGAHLLHNFDGGDDKIGTEWQKVEVVFTNGEDGADDYYQYLQIKFRWLNSQWGFDNFSLHEVEHSTEVVADDCDYEEGDVVNADGYTCTIKSGNMFVNGGFNNGVEGWTAGNEYTKALEASAVTFTETGGYNDGQYLTLKSSAGAAAETTPTQAIAVEPGKSYLFVGYTSGKTPTSGNLRYSALFEMDWDENEGRIAEKSHTEGSTSYSNTIIQLEWGADPEASTDEWTQTIGVFTVPTEEEESTYGTYSYVGMRMNWSTGSYDGFQLYEVEAVELEYAYDVTWELANPSFEVDKVANLTEDATRSYTEDNNEDSYTGGAYTIGNGLTGWTLGGSNTVSDLMTEACKRTDNNFGAPGTPTDGTQMLYLRNNATTTASVEQTITLPAGDYKLTVDAKCVSSSSSTATLVADGKSKVLDVHSTYEELDWDTAVLTFSLDATTDVTVGVDISYSGNGSFLLDNFKLYSVDAIEEEITWTMTTAGWGTMILPFAASIPEGLTAYAGDALTIDDSTITVGEVATSIAANTAYIVKSEVEVEKDTDYTFSGTPVNETEIYTTGALTGTLVDLAVAKGAVFAADGTEYLLQDHGEADDGLAFYPIIAESSSEATLSAYHCYLTIESEDAETSPAKLSIVLPGTGEETGIVAVESETLANDAIYDLSGRRVSKAVKGVYIQNGKKVLVK